jgi:heme-degrading monooxygenase HmoA
MSVLIITTVQGDPEAFQKSLVDRAADYDRISADARQQGALSHKFGIGEGEIVIADVWADEASFRQFFSSEELRRFMTEVGADPNTPPDIMVYEYTDATAF